MLTVVVVIGMSLRRDRRTVWHSCLDLGTCRQGCQWRDPGRKGQKGRQRPRVAEPEGGGGSGASVAPVEAGLRSGGQRTGPGDGDAGQPKASLPGTDPGRLGGKWKEGSKRGEYLPPRGGGGGHKLGGAGPSHRPTPDVLPDRPTDGPRRRERAALLADVPENQPRSRINM